MAEQLEGNPVSSMYYLLFCKIAVLSSCYPTNEDMVLFFKHFPGLLEVQAENLIYFKAIFS